MEGNGRIYSNVGGGILGLEMPLHPSQTNQNHIQKHPQMMHAPLNHHHLQQQQQDQQTQLTMKQPTYPYTNPNPNPPPAPAQRNKTTQMTQSPISDEDDQNDQLDGGYSCDGKRKTMSPWQRMKWTDNMVRLLIMAVYCIGDDQNDQVSSDKKKQTAGLVGSILQKKGKWKSVSKALMEKGFYVSPQQCEDKFNDLNKRYKRVTDILGKGTACRVVENQSLLETMDHLSPKLKEEARKLLNSKHLFFKEMCTYHRSCGHDVGVQQQQQPQPPPQQQQQQQQQTCFHSSIPQPSLIIVPTNPKPEDHDHDEEEDDEDDDDEDEEEDDEDENDENEEEKGRKRARTMDGVSTNSQALLQLLSGETMGVFQDGTKTSWEKKFWVMKQLVQLEEKGVKFQQQTLELEKQRMKWIKFSNKKEREMEKMKQENERNKLYNDKMVLFLRNKEIELLANEQQQQQQQQHRSTTNPSCVTG